MCSGARLRVSPFVGFNSRRRPAARDWRGVAAGGLQYAAVSTSPTENGGAFPGLSMKSDDTKVCVCGFYIRSRNAFQTRVRK